MRKLNNEELQEFTKLLVQEGWPVSKLRDKFKMNTSTAYSIAESIRGKRVNKYPRKGDTVSSRIGSDNIHKILHRRFIDKAQVKVIASEFGLSESNISNIVSGRIWKNEYITFDLKYPGVLTRKRIRINN